jgi:P2 family phage major capsid protein
MKKETRLAYHAYIQRLAQLNEVSQAHETFNVVPSVQQKLEGKIQESSSFLSKINLIGVTEQEGEKLGLSISSPIASRTDTNRADRQTRDLSTLDSQRYRCEKTNFDTHIGYAKLDAWAKFPDFQQRIANQILIRQGLDRMVIGFHGVSIATDTDLDKNPMLEDVNKGWLQHYREQAPQRVMGEGKEANQVLLGTGGDYANLDALVFDAINLLDPWYRKDTGLVAITGRQLLSDKYFPMVNVNQGFCRNKDLMISWWDETLPNST